MSETAWEPGIPGTLSPEDRMTGRDLLPYGVDAVYHCLRDRVNILNVSDNPASYPHIVARKKGQLFFIDVRAESALALIGLSKDFHQMACEHARKNKALPVYAPCIFSSDDPQRSSVGLLLKGEEMWCSILGLYPLHPSASDLSPKEEWRWFLLAHLAKTYHSGDPAFLFQYLNPKCTWSKYRPGEPRLKSDDALRYYALTRFTPAVKVQIVKLSGNYGFVRNQTIVIQGEKRSSFPLKINHDEGELALYLELDNGEELIMRISLAEDGRIGEICLYPSAGFRYEIFSDPKDDQPDVNLVLKMKARSK